MWRNGDVANGHILVDGSWTPLRLKDASDGDWVPGDVANGHVLSGNGWIPIAPEAAALAPRQAAPDPPRPPEATASEETGAGPALEPDASPEPPVPPVREPAPAPRQVDTWQAAETNAAEWMRYWGYDDAAVTAGGADGGIDVRSSRALAQVKWEASQVGSPAIQRLVGARGMSLGLDLLFFSGAGFSKAAVDYADSMRVALFKYDLVGAMTPVNPAAAVISARGADGTLPGTSDPRAVFDAACDRFGEVAKKGLRAAEATLDGAAVRVITREVDEVSALMDDLTHRSPVSVAEITAATRAIERATARLVAETPQSHDEGAGEVTEAGLKDRANELFNTAKNEFVQQAQLALEKAELSSRGQEIAELVSAEVATVRTIAEGLLGRSVDLDDLQDAVDQVAAATARVARAARLA